MNLVNVLIGIVVRHAPLSYHDTQALVAPGVHHLVEEVGHRLLIAVTCLAILLVGIAPVIVLHATGIIPWLVVMELHAHIVVGVALDVTRNDEIAIVDTKLRVAHVGLNDEMTLHIVAARGTHHVDEDLVVGVLHFEVLCSWLAPVVLDMHLVGTCEGEASIVVGKLGSDVLPSGRAPEYTSPGLFSETEFQYLWLQIEEAYSGSNWIAMAELTVKEMTRSIYDPENEPIK